VLKGLKCVYLNARSAAKPGALDSLKFYCISHSIDILLLTETWFDDSVRDAELSFDNEYQSFRCDRSTRGGGVCIFARKHVKIIRVDCSYPVEFVIVDLMFDLTYLRVICYYISSSGSASQRLSQVGNFSDVLTSVQSLDRPLLVVGDFNFPRINWNLVPFSDA